MEQKEISFYGLIRSSNRWFVAKPPRVLMKRQAATSQSKKKKKKKEQKVRDDDAVADHDLAASILLPEASIPRPSNFQVTVLYTAKSEIPPKKNRNSSWNYVSLPIPKAPPPPSASSDCHVLLLSPGQYKNEDIVKYINGISFREKRHIELIGLGATRDAIDIKIDLTEEEPTQMGYTIFDENLLEHAFRIKNLTLGGFPVFFFTTLANGETKLKMEFDQVNFQCRAILSLSSLSGSSRITFSNCILDAEGSCVVRVNDGSLIFSKCKFSTKPDMMYEDEPTIIHCSRSTYLEITDCDLKGCCSHTVSLDTELTEEVFKKRVADVMLFLPPEEQQERKEELKLAWESSQQCVSRVPEWKFERNILQEKCAYCPIAQLLGGQCLSPQERANREAAVKLERAVAFEQTERRRLVDFVPSNAPRSMKKAVKRWNLLPPYDVATESAWKEYIAFRDKAARGVEFSISELDADAGNKRPTPDKREIKPVVAFPESPLQKKPRKPLTYVERLHTRKHYESELRKRLVLALQYSRLGQQLRWTRATHRFFPPTFRREVKLLLLVLHRLGYMPPEIVQMIIQYLASNSSGSEKGIGLLRGLYLRSVECQWCDEPPRSGEIQAVLFSPCGVPRYLQLSYYWYYRKRTYSKMENAQCSVTETRFGEKAPDSCLFPFNWFKKLQKRYNTTSRWTVTSGFTKHSQRFLLLSDIVSNAKWCEVLALASGVALFDWEPLWAVAHLAEQEPFDPTSERPYRNDYPKILKKCPTTEIFDDANPLPSDDSSDGDSDEEEDNDEEDEEESD